MAPHTLPTVLTALALLACSPAPVQESAPPDVVLVLTDDLRHDSLGCTGSDVIATPQLDRLAAEGVLFETALVVTALCCPSRASLLTGVYGHRHGVLNNAPPADVLDGQVTFPELFQAAGYETAYIGKWHLPNPGAAPFRGFDHWVSFEGQGQYFDQMLWVDGVSTPTRGYLTDLLVERALEWTARPREGPYLLVLATKSAHYPFDPSPARAGALAGADIRFSPSIDDPLENLPVHLQKLRMRPNLQRVVQDRRVFRHGIQTYSETVMSLDDAVGRLAGGLRARGALDDTLLVFTSDNGLLWGEHGIPHKICTFEPAIRVPLIVRWPAALPAGARVAAPVLNVDVPATLLDAAGIEVPRAVQGESLLGLMAGEPWRTSTLHYEAPDRDAPTPDPVELAVRTERWKYQRYLEPSLEEFLFDLEVDPDERVNLAHDPAHAEELERLRGEMRGLMAEYDVPATWYGAR
jgi:N-acetylglucosamine-6-sulfatase